MKKFKPQPITYLRQLRVQTSGATSLCNRKQDPSLYPCKALQTFSSYTWGISRADFAFRRDFVDNAGFKRFVSELLEGIRGLYDPMPSQISMYIYYGSVQILRAVQIARKELQAQGTDLKTFLCLFHESVIMNAAHPEPRFPPNANDILLEAAAQIDNFRIASVTERLAGLILDNFGVETSVFPNPPPNLSDAESDAILQERLAAPARCARSDLVRVLFPTNPREEKGAQIMRDLLGYLRQMGVPKGQRYMMRGSAPKDAEAIVGVEFLGDEISDDSYWNNLRNADVVVIPYMAPNFSYRTSGIVVDTMVYAVPIIVMVDTWQADVVERAGAGLVVNYRSPHSIVSAINVVIENRRTIRTNLRKGVTAYLEENSWLGAAMFAKI